MDKQTMQKVREALEYYADATDNYCEDVCGGSCCEGQCHQELKQKPARRALALLDAIPATTNAEVPLWQPISAAPVEDGYKVLGRCGPEGEPFIAEYDADEGCYVCEFQTETAKHKPVEFIDFRWLKAPTTNAGVPDGWVLVPIKPTGNMLCILANGADLDDMEVYDERWAAALRSAPTPPATFEQEFIARQKPLDPEIAKIIASVPAETLYERADATDAQAARDSVIDDAQTAKQALNFLMEELRFERAENKDGVGSKEENAHGIVYDFIDRHGHLALKTKAGA